jgi:tripeptide aminopeptidase
MEKFKARKKYFEASIAAMNTKYGEGTFSLEMKDQYYNMKEKVEPQMHIVDIAEEAMNAAGIKADIKAIRGGTDGSRLSYMGLPCPNIFAGGLNFHGRYEYVPIQSMEKVVQVIVNVAKITAERADA